MYALIPHGKYHEYKAVLGFTDTAQPTRLNRVGFSPKAVDEKQLRYVYLAETNEVYFASIRVDSGVDITIEQAKILRLLPTGEARNLFLQQLVV